MPAHLIQPVHQRRSDVRVGLLQLPDAAGKRVSAFLSLKKENPALWPGSEGVCCSVFVRVLEVRFQLTVGREGQCHLRPCAAGVFFH